MNDLRKAAEMALEFVEWFARDDHSVRPKHKAPEIAEALQQALAKREWVGLTKEDMPVGDNPMFDTDEFAFGAAWAQAKLKEKNT